MGIFKNSKKLQEMNFSDSLYNDTDMTAKR